MVAAGGLGHRSARHELVRRTIARRNNPAPDHAATAYLHHHDSPPSHSLKTTYTADPAPGVVLGVTTSFRTPYGNELTLRGVKRAPNASRPSELQVFPDSGPGLRVEPTPAWIVAVGDAPDYGWAATAAGPPTEAAEHGCLPRERPGGMAILTRERAPPEALLRQARASLGMQGYDTSALVPTRQDCDRV